MTPQEQQMKKLQDELNRLKLLNETKNPEEEKITIKGNKFLIWLYSLLFNLFNKIAKNYEQKKLKHENKEFILKEFKFESPRLIFITFTNLLTKQDYEVVLHSETGYLNYYKEYQETKKIPQMIKIDKLIKNNYKTAIKV